MPKQIGADKRRESRTLGEAVSAEITRLRVGRGWSQQKLAHELGYTERYIGQLERGTKSQPCEPLPISLERLQRSPPRSSELPSSDSGIENPKRH